MEEPDVDSSNRTMNLSRARELFSAYFEGELDAALKHQFEAALNASEELQNEYAEFVAFFGELGTMSEEEIDVPMYLSDRIATRLEEAQAKRSTGLGSFGFGWLTGAFSRFAVGGLVAAAILGAGIGIMSKGGPAAADLVPFWNPSEKPPVANVNPLEYSFDGQLLSLTYQVQEHQTLTVNGQPVRPKRAGDRTITVNLPNPGVKSAEVSIAIEGGNLHETVIVPGKDRSGILASTGQIQEFAHALADRYGVPVRLTVGDSKAAIAWNFTPNNPYDAAKSALDKTGFTADKRANGLIVIGGQ